MNRLEMSKNKINRTIHNHEKFNFSFFLEQLRDDLSISRRVMAEDLGLPYMKIFYLELGEFRRSIPVKIVHELADYFGVPREIMEEKAIAYRGISRRYK